MLGSMAAAHVTSVFKHIIQSPVSRDAVTDTLKAPEELDVIMVALCSGCVGKSLFPIAL